MDLKELAREPELSQAAVSAAEEIGDHCIERPYHNYQLTLAAQIIQAALQRAVADARAEWLKLACEAVCPSCAGKWKRLFAQEATLPAEVGRWWHEKLNSGAPIDDGTDCHADAIRRAFAAAQDDPEVSR